MPRFPVAALNNPAPDGVILEQESELLKAHFTKSGSMYVAKETIYVAFHPEGQPPAYSGLIVQGNRYTADQLNQMNADRCGTAPTFS